LSAERNSAVDRLGPIFDRLHGRLYTLALRLTSDPAEADDLVQEAFLKVARSPERLPTGERSEEAWLVRVLVNLSRDRFRRSAVRRRYARENPGETAEPPRQGSSVVARLTVGSAMRRLEPRRRAIVILRYLEDLEPREIAELLGLPGATVRWHLARARRELAQQLDEERT
jgi:RNA polymerase sigma-70 factor (ECF subfamily)